MTLQHFIAIFFSSNVLMFEALLKVYKIYSAWLYFIVGLLSKISSTSSIAKLLQRRVTFWRLYENNREWASYLFLRLFLKVYSDKLQVWDVALLILYLQSPQFSHWNTTLIIQASLFSSLESRQLCLTSQGPFNLYHPGWNRSSGAFSFTLYNRVWVVCGGGFLLWQEKPRIYVVKEPFSLKFICGLLCS